MATEAERLLKCSGWLPEVLRRAELIALDGDEIAEGQGADAADRCALSAFSVPPPDQSSVISGSNFAE